MNKVFREIPKNPSKARVRPSFDYQLTRYACRLIIMAEHADKAITILAFTYFRVEEQNDMLSTKAIFGQE